MFLTCGPKESTQSRQTLRHSRQRSERIWGVIIASSSTQWFQVPTMTFCGKDIRISRFEIAISGIPVRHEQLYYTVVATLCSIFNCLFIKAHRL